ncbi:MAG: hypothetical protein KDN22_05890 [Verrucomicrobiae bacterium]|nr:hypothetical protein [Verrucomicrobiae bacterium]
MKISLQYLVVSQDPNERQAWLYQRANDWDQEEGAPNGTIRLDSIDFSLALDEVYESQAGNRAEARATLSYSNQVSSWE